MSVDEYCAAMREYLEKFQTNWNSKVNANDPNYPADLPEEEWDEQFIASLGIEQ